MILHPIPDTYCLRSLSRTTPRSSRSVFPASGISGRAQITREQTQCVGCMFEFINFYQLKLCWNALLYVRRTRSRQKYMPPLQVQRSLIRASGSDQCSARPFPPRVHVPPDSVGVQNYKGSHSANQHRTLRTCTSLAPGHLHGTSSTTRYFSFVST